jgi:hypothetical protein
MQNAWRFVEDPELRERLKEAKGKQPDRSANGDTKAGGSAPTSKMFG